LQQPNISQLATRGESRRGFSNITYVKFDFVVGMSLNQVNSRIVLIILL